MPTSGNRKLFDLVLRTNLWFFNFGSAVGCLPLKIDRAERTISPTSSSFRRRFWYFHTFLAFLQLVYVWATFGLSFLYPEQYYVATHAPFHFGFGFASIYCIVSGIFYFHYWPKTFALVWTTLLQKAHLVERYSHEQLCFLALPYALTGIMSTIILLFSFDGTWVQELKYFVSTSEAFASGDSRYVGLMVAAHLVEVYLALRMGFYCLVCWATHLIMFEVQNAHIDLLNNIVRHSAKSSTHFITELRRTQLILQFFNLTNSTSIFIVKMMALSVAVFGFASVIRSGFEEDFFAAFLNFYMGLFGIFTFPVIYRKAFAIPFGIQKLKLGLLAHVGGEKSRNGKLGFVQGRARIQDAMKRAIVKRQIASVPAIGIQVGGFHTVERQSTLVFLHLFVGMLASALLSFEI